MYEIVGIPPNSTVRQQGSSAVEASEVSSSSQDDLLPENECVQQQLDTATEDDVESGTVITTNDEQEQLDDTIEEDGVESGTVVSTNIESLSEESDVLIQVENTEMVDDDRHSGITTREIEAVSNEVDEDSTSSETRALSNLFSKSKAVISTGEESEASSSHLELNREVVEDEGALFSPRQASYESEVNSLERRTQLEHR